MAQRETVLPRTVVPGYLDETPLAVQARHEASATFSVENQPFASAGNTATFPRPSMSANLALIESNLEHLAGYYFDMPWRKPETP